MDSVVLLTGGMGYIGIHTCVALIEAGYQVIIFDNLSNSKYSALHSLKQILGKAPPFIEGDIRNRPILRQLFKKNRVFSVIHFAGLKSLNEALVDPLNYYDNNVKGSLELLLAMGESNIRNIIFSSSATVYGKHKKMPIKEDFTRFPHNPYGRSKLIVEQMLEDLCKADPNWRAVCLRYFNPIGAHPSGLIGEDPKDIPSNLVPYVLQVAIGRRKVLNIYGDDYPTPDGTAIRDYVHVMDLAEAHVSALTFCNTTKNDGFMALNLGTGKGSTVLDVVSTIENISLKKIPYNFVGRRAGDLEKCWADPSLAFSKLQWKAKKTLADACKDAWNWQKQNPEGYQ